MKTKGWGPWRYDWYSICSAHMEDHSDSCNMCAAGYWSNNWRNHFSNLIFKLSPNFWIWWVNRR